MAAAPPPPRRRSCCSISPTFLFMVINIVHLSTESERGGWGKGEILATVKRSLSFSIRAIQVAISSQLCGILIFHSTKTTTTKLHHQPMFIKYFSPYFTNE